MHVFYDVDKITNWLKEADFPLVFKLKGGASSSNVILLKSKEDADRLIMTMFNKGFKTIRPVMNDFKTKISIHSYKKDWLATIKRLPITLSNIKKVNQKLPRQYGYFLVQEFIPNNDFDTRVVVVGSKAFSFRRYNRPDDFRASGSKNVDLNQEFIDKRAIKLSFEAARKIGSLSMAFDIIYNSDNEPVIIEMSYTCPVETINRIGGYWDPSLVYHSTDIRLEDSIMENALNSIS